MVDANNSVPTSPGEISEGLVDRSYIARDFQRSVRTVRNWESAGILPPRDTTFLGIDYWSRARYQAWKGRVLRGEFAGTARIDNVRSRSAAQTEPQQAT